jgi:hypothetical protein
MAASTITVCKLAYDYATEEWIVRAYTHRLLRVPEADYFTTDKADAWGTAIAMLDHAKPAGATVHVDTKHRCAWWTPKGEVAS